MEDKDNEIEILIQKAETYSKTTYELTRLRLLKVSIGIVSSLISNLGFVFAMVLFVVVFSIGVALMVGEWLGKSYYGFFIVSGVYLVAGIICGVFLRKWIRKPISEMMIRQVLQK